MILLQQNKKRRGSGKKCLFYESTKRKLKRKYICGCRCYERLQTKTKEFTRLSYTEIAEGKVPLPYFYFLFFFSFPTSASCHYPLATSGGAQLLAHWEH
jgi:hypothetical protein